MKEKIKKIIFGYLPGFLTGLIICGSISVIAAIYFPSNDVTYDNTKSGLASTNVQGAIDELYGVCTAEPPAGETIIEDAELEKDPYECRYFFTGANPNNYITFNDETAGWRIVSVECDGTIKIMKNDSIGNMAWDTSRSNNWARPAEINTYLNEIYYNTLSSIAKSQIIPHNFSIGAFYSDDLSSHIIEENSNQWSGKIALPTVSEYLRTNSNINCKTNISYNTNVTICKDTTWMMGHSNWWFITPPSGVMITIYRIDKDGYVGLEQTSSTSYGIKPTIYLTSEITLTGSGTQSDPYTIE